MQLKNPRFVTTAVDPKDYPTFPSGPDHFLPEIALAGRSNVGKSSLLNHLFHRKNLVKTSATPGKTQVINFFSTDNNIIFVDLPGYGYAKVPLTVRKKWAAMVQKYLEKRESLKAILFLFDIRRLPNDEDQQMLVWARYHEIPIILVLTKVDKLTQNEKRAQKEKILTAFGDDQLESIYYSVPKNVGRHELLLKIHEVIGS